MTSVHPGSLPKGTPHTPAPTPLPVSVRIAASPLVTIVALAGAAWLLDVSSATFLLTVASGMTIGWVHRLVKIRNAQLDAFIAALFGSHWQRDDRLLIALDILSRALVGIAVGLAFAELGHLLHGGGNGPPPPGPDVVDLLLTLLRFAIFLACAAVLGAGVMMFAEGVSAHVLAASASTIAAGSAKAMIKAAAIAAAEQQQAGMSYWRVAQKGAVTAVLVALVGRLFGL